MWDRACLKIAVLIQYGMIRRGWRIVRQFSKNFPCCALILLTGCISVPGNEANVAELRQRAETGDVTSQRLVAEAYEHGRGVQKDYTEAAKWYQKAADQGDAKAQNNLGSFYQYGLGVTTNYARAVELYKKSAEQGFMMAQSNLGYMYDYGLGVPKDKGEAISWYRRAADQGYPGAMMNLGISYITADGVERDIPRAYMWLDCARWLTQFDADKKTKWMIRGALNRLENRMTPEEIHEGEKLAKEWSKHYLETQNLPRR